MGKLISFYSFKGGVGRTQLCCNVASYLAFKRNKRVLLWDWDFEAPGISHYFEIHTIDPKYVGTVDLFESYLTLDHGTEEAYKTTLEIDHIIDLGKPLNRDDKNDSCIHLLPSGNFSNPKYSSQIVQFDWYYFFHVRNGKDYVSWLKSHLLKEYDYVLIDSRTGLSDYGGICNKLLPDINVLLMAANHQNIRNTERIAKDIKQSDATRLILPVLTRLNTNHEKFGYWANEFSAKFYHLLAQLDPRILEPFSFQIFQDFYLENTILWDEPSLSVGENLLFNRGHQYISNNSFRGHYQNISNFLIQLTEHNRIQIDERIDKSTWERYYQEEKEIYENKRYTETNPRYSQNATDSRKKLSIILTEKLNKLQQAEEYGETLELLIKNGEESAAKSLRHQAIKYFLRALKYDADSEEAKNGIRAVYDLDLNDKLHTRNKQNINKNHYLKAFLEGDLFEIHLGQILGIKLKNSDLPKELRNFYAYLNPENFSEKTENVVDLPLREEHKWSDESKFEAPKKIQTKLPQNFFDKQTLEARVEIKKDKENEDVESPREYLRIEHFAALNGNVEALKTIVKNKEKKHFDFLSNQKNGSMNVLQAALTFYSRKWEDDILRYLLYDESGKLHSDASKWINLTDGKGRDSFHHAVLNNHEDIVKEFLKIDGVDPFRENNDSWKPIHICAFLNNKTILGQLLRITKKTSNLNEKLKGPQGTWPHHIAAYYSHVSFFTKLQKSIPIDENVLDNRGWNVLHFASAYADEQMIRYILDIKTPKFSIGFKTKEDDAKNAIYLAGLYGELESFRLLIERGEKFVFDEVNGENILHMVVRTESKDKIDFLLSLDQNIVSKLAESKNLEGNTPLEIAYKISDNEKRQTTITSFLKSNLVQTLVFHEKNVGRKNRFVDYKIRSEKSIVSELKIDFQSIKQEDWPFVPIVEGNWDYGVELGAVSRLLHQLGNVYDWVVFSGFNKVKSARRIKLEFYKDTFLYELLTYKDETFTGFLTFIAPKSSEISLLSGASPVIHELNRKIPLELDAHNLKDYLKFFCHSVHGEEGAFTIIDSGERLSFFNFGEKEDLVKSLVSKLSSRWNKKSKIWKVEANIKYSNAVFSAKFEVENSGMVKMTDDEPLLSDLKFSSEVFINYLRTYIRGV